MPNSRRQDQSVDAFSLPSDLLAKAKARAAQMGMTRSGFYRYCLAKFLGYSEADARTLAEHRAVLNSIERATKLEARYLRHHQSLALNDQPSETANLVREAESSYEKARRKK